MEGISLSLLAGELFPVGPDHQEKPAETIENWEEKLGPWLEWARDGDPKFNLLTDMHRLPLAAFEGFSFDEFCKLRYSTIFTMQKDVDELFESDPQYEFVRKIKSSMWHWGWGVWNDVVDAHEKIRTFRFGPSPDFSVQFDHSTYHNEFGYSKYARVFLDGELAYLIHYKGKPVMTIGFSIAGGRKLLLQQVQLRERTGNRFLYKLPRNYLEYVIECLSEHFAGYTLYLVDGELLVKRIMRDYENGCEHTRRSVKRAREALATAKPEDREEALRWFNRQTQELGELETKLAHFKQDAARIIAFYGMTGRYERKEEYSRYHLTHHRLALRTVTTKKVRAPREALCVL